MGWRMRLVWQSKQLVLILVGAAKKTLKRKKESSKRYFGHEGPWRDYGMPRLDNALRLLPEEYLKGGMCTY